MLFSIAPFKACRSPGIPPVPVSHSVTLGHAVWMRWRHLCGTVHHHAGTFLCFFPARSWQQQSSVLPQGRAPRRGHGSVLPAGHPAVGMSMALVPQHSPLLLGCCSARSLPAPVSVEEVLCQGAGLEGRLGRADFIWRDR